MKRFVTAGLLTTAMISSARGENRQPPPPPSPGIVMPRPGGEEPDAQRMPPSQLPVPPFGTAPFGTAPFGAVPIGPPMMGDVSPGAIGPVSPDPFFGPRRPMLVQNFAWAFVDVPRPREIKIHDIITIQVKEVAETNASSRYNRQRNGSLKAELKEFIRFSDGRLLNAAENQPTIDGNLQSRLQSTGQVAEMEAIKYFIAATVVDILPNGVLVLEARKTISNNGDISHYTLTGKLRPQDIGENNTARSENIAEMNISRVPTGKLRDSTQRAWGVRLYDKLSPF